MYLRLSHNFFYEEVLEIIQNIVWINCLCFGSLSFAPFFILFCWGFFTAFSFSWRLSSKDTMSDPLVWLQEFAFHKFMSFRCIKESNNFGTFFINMSLVVVLIGYIFSWPLQLPNIDTCRRSSKFLKELSQVIKFVSQVLCLRRLQRIIEWRNLAVFIFENFLLLLFLLIFKR